MRQSFTRKLITSPWMIAIFLTIAWGPLFVADFLRDARPGLDASYAP
ncbi:MAG TPA: hypothetical protein VN610_09280 [Bryobacteraceae bacterium]|nr:hypothetical protein [Bryobacteraceae bacterium]